MSVDCSIQGNNDLYGLGVRIGLYAQWGATLLATLFDPRNEATFRLANLIIQVAIFLGLCTEYSSMNSSHHAVGAVVTMFLLCGSLSSLTGDGISYLGHFSGMLRIGFYMALSAYGVWFWFRGIDGMVKEGCEQIIFFNGAGIHGPIRSLGKAVAVIALVTTVALAGAGVYAAYLRFKDGFEEGFKQPERKRPQVEVALLVLSMGLIALSIVTVEYLIRVNNVEGVGAGQIKSVGQLIPLLAGGVAATLTTWRIVMHGLLWRRRCWFLFGWHL